MDPTHTAPAGGAARDAPPGPCGSCTAAVRPDADWPPPLRLVGGRLRAIDRDAPPAVRGSLLIHLLRRPGWLREGVVCADCVAKLMAQGYACLAAAPPAENTQAARVIPETGNQKPATAQAGPVQHAPARPPAARLSAVEARAAEMLAAVLEDVRASCAASAHRATRRGGDPLYPAPVSPTTRRPQRAAHATAACLGIELRAAEACLILLADRGLVAVERRPLAVAGVLVRSALFAEPTHRPAAEHAAAAAARPPALKPGLERPGGGKPGGPRAAPAHRAAAPGGTPSPTPAARSRLTDLPPSPPATDTEGPAPAGGMR